MSSVDQEAVDLLAELCARHSFNSGWVAGDAWWERVRAWAEENVGNRRLARMRGCKCGHSASDHVHDPGGVDRSCRSYPCRCSEYSPKAVHESSTDTPQ